MQSIHAWDDLSRYGIIPLTGEACGLMYRILCDVTRRGQKTLEKAFGIVQLRLPECQRAPKIIHLGALDRWPILSW